MTSTTRDEVKALQLTADTKSMRVSLLLSLCFIAIGTTLGSGCGGGQSTGEKAFGDLTQADKKAIRQYSGISEAWPRGFGALATAEEADDVTGMRQAVDALTKRADRAVDTVLDFDSAKLRGDFEVHAEGMQRVASALDSYVAYLEDENTPQDSRLEGDLGRDIESAALALSRADRKVINRILEATDPEDRPELRAKLRAAQEKSERQASGETP